MYIPISQTKAVGSNVRDTTDKVTQRGRLLPLLLAIILWGVAGGAAAQTTVYLNGYNSGNMQPWPDHYPVWSWTGYPESVVACVGIEMGNGSMTCSNCGLGQYDVPNGDYTGLHCDPSFYDGTSVTSFRAAIWYSGTPIYYSQPLTIDDFSITLLQPVNGSNQPRFVTFQGSWISTSSVAELLVYYQPHYGWDTTGMTSTGTADLVRYFGVYSNNFESEIEFEPGGYDAYAYLLDTDGIEIGRSATTSFIVIDGVSTSTPPIVCDPPDSILDVGGGVKYGLCVVFKPSDSVVNLVTTAKDRLSDRVPFSYLNDVGDIIDTVATATTPTTYPVVALTYNFLGTGTTTVTFFNGAWLVGLMGDANWATLRAWEGYIMYILAIFAGYYIARSRLKL